MSIKRRTIKSILYRVYSFIITWLVMLLLMPGNIVQVNTITIIVEVIKTLNFFLFDYVWDRLKKHEAEIKNDNV